MEHKPEYLEPPLFEPAVYKPQTVRHYVGNPLIEALPSIQTLEECAEQLTYHAPYNEQDRLAPSEERLHMIEMATTFYQPMDIQLDLAQRTSRMIRTGYLGKRNPMSLTFFRDLQTRIDSMDNRERHKYLLSFPHGFTIIGISGIGKTSAVARILSLYPQVICHRSYAGKPFSRLQVVWLMLQCPHDGSTKALCKQFFYEMDKILGTNYSGWYASARVSVDDLIRSMARVAELHSLGVLVIDEIQLLSQAKSGGKERMLNFFLQLVNEIGLPVILIGTYQAHELFTHNLRLARRCTGEGDLIWERMQYDEQWEQFLCSLWRYQYIRNRVELTREMSYTLYEQSIGITDIAIKLYMFGQVRAILTAPTPNDETITSAIIRSVAADSFRTVVPILAKVRSGDPGALKQLEDVRLPITFNQFVANIERSK